MLGKFLLTEMEFDAKVDDPYDAMLDLAHECTMNNNLVSVDIKNQPKYIYKGDIYYCSVKDRFPALNGELLPSTTVIDKHEDVVQDKIKEQIDLLRKHFPEDKYYLFGKISKEWVKENA